MHSTLVSVYCSYCTCVYCRYDTSLADSCIQLADRWSATTPGEDGGFTASDLDDMSSNQLQEFLNQLHSKVIHTFLLFFIVLSLVFIL